MIKRALRHLFTTTAAGRRAFPDDVMKGIQAAIAHGEKLHRAEIRIMVEPALDVWDVLAGMSSRQRARELFTEYRIWDTEENSGILVYINLADHKVEIVADRGVNKLLEAAQWQQVCSSMTRAFSKDRYEDGVVEGINELHGWLAARLPCDGSNPNELSNRPLML